MEPAELGARLTLVARRGVDETALGRLGAFLSQPATSKAAADVGSCAIPIAEGGELCTSSCDVVLPWDTAGRASSGRRSASARTATAAARQGLAARPASACSPAQKRSRSSSPN